MHEHSRSLRVGGYISSGVLILFGVAVIVLGIWALLFTRDHIEQQNIALGPARSGRKRARRGVVGPRTGGHRSEGARDGRDHARAHLSSTGGLTYAEMGQYQSAADPTDPVGTSDPAKAVTEANGDPVSNGAEHLDHRKRLWPRGIGHGLHAGRCSPSSASGAEPTAAGRVTSGSSRAPSSQRRPQRRPPRHPARPLTKLSREVASSASAPARSSQSAQMIQMASAITASDQNG